MANEQFREQHEAAREAGLAQRHVTRQERAEQREEIERLRGLLSEAADALVEVGKKALVVKPSLDKPYPDDARWTPWTRFLGPSAEHAWSLGHKLRREIGSRETEGS
jgi:hypothetical protein